MPQPNDAANAGDASMERGALESGWAFAKSAGSGATDAFVGTVKGLASLAVGGYSLATDSAAREKAWEMTKRVAGAAQNYGAEAAQDPAKVYRDARDGALSLYESFDQARQEAATRGRSEEFWGDAVGRAGFEIGTLLVPVGAAAKAGKLGKVAKVADAGADLAKGVKIADNLEDGGSAAARAKRALNNPALAAADEPVSKIKPCAKAKGSSQAAETLDDMYARAPAAKGEIDDLAEAVAKEHGGDVAKTDIKSRESAQRKIDNDYDGNPTRIKDLARNTIVVPAGKELEVAEALKQANPNIEIVVTSANSPLGYSDVKAIVPTKSGIKAEIQINSPEMIYAKESPEVAKGILKGKYDELVARKDLPPGGQGHKMYEEWRELDVASARAEEIAAQSREYYDKFRK